MHRILIFSDSHTDISICEKIINKISGVNMIIHAGDHAADAQLLQKHFPELDVRFVRGNCDYSPVPDDLVFEAGGCRIFVSHGHKYNVKYDLGYRSLKKAAEEKNAALAVFGHTHNPYISNDGNLILLNPGSIRYGRTFGVAEIEDKNIKADICDAGAWL